MRWRVVRAMALLACLGLLTSCAGALTWMAYRHDPRGPQTAGALELPGLTAPVEVIRDKWAIPHVFAQNEADLLRAMGYVHAQDRLAQMDLLRRAAGGRLSEIVGDRPLDWSMFFGAKTTREQDIGMRTLGFEHVGALVAELAPPETRALLEAYAQGVNAYLERHENDLPVEFGLVNYKPAPWTPKDTIVVERFLAWTLGTNAALELVQAAADAALSPERGALLLPPYNDPKAPRILPDYKFPLKRPSIAFDPKPLAPLDRSQLSLTTLYRLLNGGALPGESPQASNNWVVAGSRAVKGKPILANDPHLPHTAPSIFHLIHLSGAGYDVIGAGMPGVPFVILGHNRHTAWAATNNEADVQDLYLHKVDPSHPERYLYRDTWESFVQREETIGVREGATVRPDKITVRVSRFGPVISDAYARDRSVDVLSLRWVGMDFVGSPEAYWEIESAKTDDERRAAAERRRGQGRGDDLAAIRDVNRAANCDAYFKAMSLFGSPRQNWICGDDSGHIGYAAAGFVPVRNRGDGRRIARAWQDEGRWIAFIPFEELPQRKDPKNGYFVSANNITFDRDAYPYPWSFHDVDRSRAERIAQLLTAEPKVDAATMKRIQSDRRSGLADDYVPLFIQAAKEDDALTDARLVLERWDRDTGPDSAGAALYYVALDQLAHKVLEDDLGPDLYRAVFSTYLSEVAVLQILADEKHPFHDAVKHPGTEKWDLNYRRALSAAYARLQREQGPDPTKWRWGALHTLTNAHALGSEKALAASVNIGPEEHGGSFDTVWAAFIAFGRDRYETWDGPAYRHIVDLASPDHGWFVLDAGQWGQPLTEHYADLHELWRRNDLVPALMNRNEIEENVMGSLVLEPVKLP